MYFTEAELRLVILWATQKIWLSLGFSDEEYPFIHQDDIHYVISNTEFKDVFEDFIGAYGDWYSFHLNIYKNDKQGKLSEEESESLHALIKRRDEAKKALIEITKNS